MTTSLHILSFFSPYPGIGLQCCFYESRYTICVYESTYYDDNYDEDSKSVMCQMITLATNRHMAVLLTFEQDFVVNLLQ